MSTGAPDRRVISAEHARALLCSLDHSTRAVLPSMPNWCMQLGNQLLICPLRLQSSAKGHVNGASVRHVNGCTAYGPAANMFKLHATGRTHRAPPAA